MKKSTRLRPTVEALDTLVLLSTVTPHVAAHPIPHEAVVVAEATPVVALRGVIKASGKVSGTNATISGSGNVGKVGTASFKLTTSLVNPTTNLTLVTKKGNLFLTAANGVAVGTNSGTGTYTITGGTKSYVGATGSGTILVRVLSSSGTKITANVRFS